ncbi:MAG TPA: beta-N-acetylhexosaminidase [Acholeplasma sp.]|jgi:beta-N-acetylhexosaminidase|nr:beta-N-acetylhexosaminidase [Acholeplasma sp.]
MIKDLKNMSLDEKIGQLFVVGFNGTHYTEKLDELINKYKFGNIILFTRNISSMEDLFNLNKEIQKNMMEKLNTPAFICIDQEGGMVTRLFKGATIFPGAMTLSATGDINNAYLNGLYMAEEMDALGLNVNFAPVLDVNTNPLNPGIGVRSYSDNQKVAAEYGKKFIEGIQTKVFATAKHFPGKGDAAVDAHLGLPVVEHDLERLEKVEFVPFKEAIDANVKGVMTSHAIYPVLNKDYPATLAKEVLIDLLRNKYKFKGLVFTDGMEMQAIDDKYGAAKSAVTAVLAGADLLLYCHYEEQQIAAFNYVKEAVLEGTIPMEVLDDRVKRILKHKKEISLKYLEKSFDEIKERINKEEHQNFAKEVINNALTLVKGERFNKKDKTLFIIQKPKALTLVEEASGEDSAVIKLEKALPEYKFIVSDVNPNKEEILKLVSESCYYNQVILTTYNSNMYEGQVELIKTFLKTKKELHVISLRNPYDLHLVPEIENYVCLYEYTSNSVNALISYLKGNLEPQGKLPVKI